MGGPHEGGIIQVQGLAKAFGSTLAVKGLDLTVERGETFGLVGPDGAGKTTTLRLLAGVLAPTQGRVWIVGHDSLREVEAARACLGYMPQHFSLYRDLTVEENLNFFADLQGVGRRERQERFPRLLAFARLGDFHSRLAAQLSGGMQKKLALACTLLHRPQVLLLDEPTTGIDPISRRELWQLFQELHLEGITLLVSTPYMDEAERCSRVGLMMGGKLITVASPRVLQGMVRGELVEIRPDHLGRARAALADKPGVLELQVFGDTLKVFVDDFAHRQGELAGYLGAAGIGIQRVRRVRPRMEEAFIWLIRRGGEDVG